MKKIKEKINLFMSGRNGQDSLNTLIFICYFITVCAYFISNWLPLIFIELILLFLFIYRFFSKKITKRAIENQKYLGILRKIKQFFLRQKNKVKHRKDFIYKKCPNCKQILKLKKVKGVHTVFCPVCGKDFNIKVK